MKKLIFCIIFTFTALNSISATYTVSSTADSGPGTLRQAIEDANISPDLDTIVFDEAIDGMPISLTSGHIGVLYSLIINGNGIGSTIIESPVASIFDFNDVPVWINNCEFSGSSGPALYSGIGMSLYIDNCKFGFCNTPVGNGGAIDFQGGDISDTLAITRTTFDVCQAPGNGGAIYFETGNLIIEASTFWSNTAFGNGGGLAIDGGLIKITNSTFHQNVAVRGAGIYDDLMTPGSFLSNCTISSNTAYNEGGGIHSGGTSSASNLSLYNCLIGNNVSPLGADVYLFDTFTGSHENNLVQSCYNASSDCPVWFLTADPDISPIGDFGGPTWTVPLNPGSPAIDMGLSSVQQYYDQRGELRCPISDIGAYQSNPGLNDIASFAITECVEYTVPSGDETYFTSGVYQDTLTNMGGCDSILTITLNIPPPVIGTDIQTVCDSLTWMDGNIYYADNDTSTFNLIGEAANGCDSLVTLNLTILNSTMGTDTRTECDSLVWVDGITYYEDNNTATFILAGEAANGCDSLVTLDLTINTVNSAVTQDGTSLTADESDATYQWLECPEMTEIIEATEQNYTAVMNGDYAVVVTRDGCSDTSACYTVSGIGIIENNFGNALLIYPNPTDGNFSINLGSDYQNILITITDISGRLVRSHLENNGPILNLKLEEPAGVYFLMVESGDKKAVIRLVKE